MSAVVNPRIACIQSLHQWETGSAFADDILHESLAANRLSALDRAFFMEAFYGILRNLSALDFAISELRKDAIDPLTRQILRLGLYQIFWMRVPDHAAVNETVNLATRARSLVNALLRRALREKDRLKKALENAALDIRHSHPAFLIQRWQTHFGQDETDALCRWNNQPAAVYIRVNTLRVTVGELLRASANVTPHPAHPLALKVNQLPFTWIASGLCYVQDPSTLMACDLLDPQPGEYVLDACAAPGGKTSYLAQLMKNKGEISGCDSSNDRLNRTRENLNRLGVANVHLRQIDWLTDRPFDCGFSGPTYDRILIDAPCSNTGVIRRRIDVRWRLTPEDFRRMPETQIAIVRKTVPLLKPGGTLVYSTCSIEPEENRQVVEQISREFPYLRFVEARESFPFRDEIDGAFAAKFVRKKDRG